MASAQDAPKFRVYGKLSADIGKLSNVELAVYKNGAFEETINISKKQKFDYECDFQSKYKFEIIAEGYVNQSFEVNTIVPDNVLANNNDFPPVQTNLTQFKKFDNGDYYRLDVPVLTIKYESNIDHFEFDYDEYEDLVSILSEENQGYKKEAENLASNDKDDGKQKSYDKAVANADKLLAANQHLKARSTYEQALIFQPQAAYPKQKIIEIDTWRKEQHKKEQKLSQKDIDYDQYIKDADKLNKQQKYADAKKLYQKALDVKPNENYPRYKLEDIETTIVFKEKDNKYRKLLAEGDKFLDKKAYADAKQKYSDALVIKPDEKYPKNKINEINGILANKEKNKDKDAKRDAAYNDFIARADRLFDQQDYKASRQDYAHAGQIKPSENYPNQRIAEIDGILEKQASDRVQKAANNEAYTRAIAAGDKLFGKSNYEESKAKYQDALSYKPNESYPQEKITEIDGILLSIANEKASREKLDNDYNLAIENGDRLLSKSDYLGAKSSYQQATNLKPAESYPQKKIREIDNLLAQLDQAEREKAQLEADYAAAIAAGDNQYNAEQYVFAKTNYEKALSLKPTEPHPKNRIVEIDKILAEQANLIDEQNALNERYNGSIAKADELLAKKAYPEAKAGYSYALTIKPNESYPQTKINEIDELIRQQELERLNQEEIDKNYNAAIAKADNFYNTTDLVNAKSAYTDALSYKPKETYPASRIKQIDAKIAQLNKAERDKAKLESDYQAAITNGDNAFAEDNYIVSKNNFQQALSLKANEAYPTDKITEIDRILAEQAKLRAEQSAIDNKYNSAISKADQLFTKENFEESKATYVYALTYKPDEIYPKDRIAEIDLILIKLLDQEKAAEELNARYDAAIKKADNQLLKKEYALSKNTFEQALSYKPNERYPKTKISEIEKILSSLAEADRAQQLLDENYQKEINTADEKFENRNYYGAKTHFNKALKLKPEEKYPKNKLLEIDKILANLAQDEEERARKEKQYDEIIKKADQEFAEKTYRKSKDSYEFALRILPDKEHPKMRISKIDEILNQLEKTQKNALQRQQYEKLVKKGDREFKREEYSFSKQSFREALDIIPSEEYPRDMISKIEEIMRNRDELASSNAAVNKQYDDLIKKADNSFDNEIYEDARSYYKAAIEVKDSHPYPHDRIKEIDWIMDEKYKVLISPAHESGPYLTAIENADKALKKEELTIAEFYYTRASGFRPFEVYPKNQLKEIEKMRARIKYNAIDEKYNTAIKKGDGLFDDKEFPAARFYFKKAHALKPDEMLPIVRIKDTENGIRLMKRGEVDKDFDKAMRYGLSALSNEEYMVAEFYFDKAALLKPEESAPVIKLEEIQNIKSNLELGDTDEQYREAIRMADSYYNNGVLASARYFYKKARTYKPTASYPSDQLDEIKAFYDPEFRLKEAAFKSAIERADKALKQNDTELAKLMYNKAKEIKPKNKYVDQQLKKISQL